MFPLTTSASNLYEVVNENCILQSHFMVKSRLSRYLLIILTIPTILQKVHTTSKFRGEFFVMLCPTHPYGELLYSYFSRTPYS